MNYEMLKLIKICTIVFATWQRIIYPGIIKHFAIYSKLLQSNYVEDSKYNSITSLFKCALF